MNNFPSPRLPASIHSVVTFALSRSVACTFYSVKVIFAVLCLWNDSSHWKPDDIYNIATMWVFSLQNSGFYRPHWEEDGISGTETCAMWGEEKLPGDWNTTLQSEWIRSISVSVCMHLKDALLNLKGKIMLITRETECQVFGNISVLVSYLFFCVFVLQVRFTTKKIKRQLLCNPHWKLSRSGCQDRRQGRTGSGCRRWRPATALKKWFV